MPCEISLLSFVLNLLYINYLILNKDYQYGYYHKNSNYLIHREVIPAIGCTEPIAVALAAAKAAEVLGRKPEKIEVYLSANILKNAMGVGIPGTGMVGLPIAIALGSIIGKSAYGLRLDSGGIERR